MSLGQSPLLTRGNFALLYGGENIISKLSLLSPGDLNTVFGEPFLVIQIIFVVFLIPMLFLIRLQQCNALNQPAL